MNKNQMICLWSGVITFLVWTAHLMTAHSDFYLRRFLPITLAIAVLTAINTYTCSYIYKLQLPDKKIEEILRWLIIANAVIVVVFLFLITTTNYHNSHATRIIG
ncbi:MAG: hypothetical protein WC496_03370 [Phycisphaerae bacterium]|jgi:hypothetical protein